MGMITLPNLRWYGNQPRELFLPDAWAVELLEPPGFRKPVITPERISEAFAKPIGSPRLSELVRGPQDEVVILVDDLTRPTPIKTILPRLLRPLHEAGVPDENIRFIPATGTHAPMDNIALRKKLGDDIVERYAIYAHNPYENCNYLGDTPSGMPVHVNREFMSCNLRIGIGCITPHLRVGFGGGGKIVMPGVAGIESIAMWHGEIARRDLSSLGTGSFDNNVMYKEIVQTARMAGLQFKVDGLLNDRGEFTDLFVGDPIEEHKVGVAAAREHYAVAMPSAPKDIVISNAYGKYSEVAIGLKMVFPLVKPGGTLVIVVDAPEGQMIHYLFRSFGKSFGGRMFSCRNAAQGNPDIPEGVNLIIHTQYPDRTMTDRFAPPDKGTFTKEWDTVINLLEARCPQTPTVAVLPDATMQYFRKA